MGYTRSAVAGFGWQTILKIFGNGIALLKIMALTRLLSPAEFGIFSLVAIALGLTESFTQTGVNITLLQEQHKIEKYVSTAWVIAIGRGFVISIIMIGLGFGMSLFFNQPNLLYLISLASLVPLIKGFINPAIISLQKNLAFLSDTLYRVSLLVVDAISAVVLVWLFDSVAGWIMGLIVTSVFEVGISFIFLSLKPKFEYISSRAEVIFNQAKSLGFSSFLGYLSENADNLLIGKLVGTYGLGLYQTVYSLAHEVNYEVTKSVNHGTLPIYTKMTREPQRLRRAFLRSFSSSLLLVTLTSIPLLLIPHILIPLLFGQEWAPAIPIVRWLVLAGLAQSVAMLGYTLFLAQGRFKAMNIHLAATFSLMILLILWWGRGNLVGAVQGILVARVLTLPWLFWSIKTSLNADKS